MKYKVGDKLKPNRYTNHCGEKVSFVVVTGISGDPGDRSPYDCCTYGEDGLRIGNLWFGEEDLVPYNEAEQVAKASALTYTREIIYNRSDGTTFTKDYVESDGKTIQVEELRKHADLYRAWKRREF